MPTQKNQPGRKNQKIGYDLKLSIIDQISNGQISINHASIRFGVSRSAIDYWMKKMLSFEQKQRFMAKKDELAKLKERIEELEWIKDFQQELIAEAELEKGIDLSKKYMPEHLAKEVEAKKKALIKQGFSTNVSGSQNKPSTNE